MEEWLKGLFGIGSAIGGGLLTKEAYDRLSDIGEQSVLGTEVDGQRIPGAMELAQLGLSQTQFQPFTVTSATGGTFGVGSTGGTTMGLSPQEQALQQQLFGQAGNYLSQNVGGQTMGSGQQFLQAGTAGYGAQAPGSEAIYQTGLAALGQGIGQLGQTPTGLGNVYSSSQQAFDQAQNFLGGLGASTAGREQDVYNRIRAVQSPEEERQRMALEERLAAQGRLGVRTAQFGGTPEQLALQKAQAEAQNSAALQALSQAQREQAQQASIGQSLAGLGGQQAALGQNLQSTLQQRALQAIQQGQAGISGSQAMNLAQNQDALRAAQLGSGLVSSGINQQSGMQQLGLGALAGAYVPQAQLLAAAQPSQMYSQLAQRGQLTGAGLFGEASMSGLEARLLSEQARANLLGNIGSGLLSGLMTPQQVQTGQYTTQLVNPFIEAIGGLFN